MNEEIKLIRCHTVKRDYCRAFVNFTRLAQVQLKNQIIKVYLNGFLRLLSGAI